LISPHTITTTNNDLQKNELSTERSPDPRDNNGHVEAINVKFRDSEYSNNIVESSIGDVRRSNIGGSRITGQ